MSLLEDLKRVHEEDSLCFLWGDLSDIGNPDVVEDEIVDNGRWTIWHRAVLRRGDEYVAALYGVGATEMQENEENVEFYVVKPERVTVIKYVKV